MLYGAAGERAALDGLEMVVDRRRDRQTDRQRSRGERRWTSTQKDNTVIRLPNETDR